MNGGASEVAVIQSLSQVWLFVFPWAAACRGPLSSTISWSLLKFMSFESVMLSNYLILYHPFLLPQSFPASGFFSSESTLCIRWPKYWCFSFSSSPSKNIQGCFPLRLTVLISLQSKGLSRVFPSTTVLKLQRYHFFSLDLNILYRFLIYIYISEHLCFLNIPRCGVCLCIYLSKQFLWYFGKK